MNEKIEKYAVIVVVFAVIAGSAFWGGMKYQAYRHPAPAAGSIVIPAPPHSGGANGQATSAPKIGSAIGQVISVTSSGFTVKSPDGKTKTVSYTASTTANITVTKMTTLSPKDISVGESVFASGLLQADGSITAQMIQVTQSTPVPQPPLPPKK
ncbi:MAG: hypothetical protein Q7S26_01265 [bacterium]|nr:hypothetical protein [bacterium]